VNFATFDISFSSFLGGITIFFALFHAWAGPVILGGDDLTDHGRRVGGLNRRGWLYIENAIQSLLAGVTRPGASGIVALGSRSTRATFVCNPTCPDDILDPDPTVPNDVDAANAIASVAQNLGKSVTFFNGANAINSFFAQLAQVIPIPQFFLSKLVIWLEKILSRRMLATQIQVLEHLDWFSALVAMGFS